MVALTTINGDPATYAEAMAGPLREHLKRAIDEESTSIHFNDTYIIVSCKQAKQLFVKLVSSRCGLQGKEKHQWVYMVKGMLS
jgi:hypothetical protein